MAIDCPPPPFPYASVWVRRGKKGFDVEYWVPYLYLPYKSITQRILRLPPISLFKNWRCLLLPDYNFESSCSSANSRCHFPSCGLVSCEECIAAESPWLAFLSATPPFSLVATSASNRILPLHSRHITADSMLPRLEGWCSIPSDIPTYSGMWEVLIINGTRFLVSIDILFGY